MPPEKVSLYQQGGMPFISCQGLERYWRKKAEANA